MSFPYPLSQNSGLRFREKGSEKFFFDALHIESALSIDLGSQHNYNYKTYLLMIKRIDMH